MKQRFLVKSQNAFEQLETELNRLGYTWSSGKGRYARELMRQHGRKLPLVVYVYTNGKHITYGSVEHCREEIDATFEIGMQLFQDTDGNVHIYETSKPLDEQPEEPRYRYVQVSIDEMLSDYVANGDKYYYEDENDSSLQMLWATTPMFTIDQLGETRFYKREEF